jgi:AraC family transcriptional regulator
MDTLKQLNEAMRYIENSLLQDLNVNQIFKTAGCSEYHFRRVFSFLAGMPLGEYVRRRRLAVAAEKIRSGNERVIDLALACGYESPEAFSKAFHSMHGLTPSEVKRGETNIKAFPPMTFQLIIRGGIEMDYRIVSKDAFQIVGFKKRVTMVFEGVNPQISSLAEKLTPDMIAELKGLSNVEPFGILSVSANFEERTVQGSELDQFIGVATTKAAPRRYDVLTVAASDWAVFNAVGTFPTAVQETWARIYSEWLPSSGYELTGGAELLWNESPDTTKQDYHSEIRIPIKKLP